MLMYCVAKTASLDILMHLPRSVFARPQLELFRWLLHVNGVEDVPSVDAVQDWCRDVQKLYGIDTLTYQGAMGHPYSVNSLNQIIAQVRLSFTLRHPALTRNHRNLPTHVSATSSACIQKIPGVGCQSHDKESAG